MISYCVYIFIWCQIMHSIICVLHICLICMPMILPRFFMPSIFIHSLFGKSMVNYETLQFYYTYYYSLSNKSFSNPLFFTDHVISFHQICVSMGGSILHYELVALAKFHENPKVFILSSCRLDVVFGIVIWF